MRAPRPDGWEQIVDDLSETATFRWLRSGRGIATPYDIQVIEKRFNVKIQPEYLTPEAMTNAMPLMLSSGNIPDVMDPGGNNRLRKYAYHGYLAEVPYEMLAEYAPNIVRLANTYIPNVWPALSMNGKNFGIPGIWYGGLEPRVGVWRMDWLTAVGIDKVPETLEEYEQALRAFRYDDPNRSGQRDTYGMSGDLLSKEVTFTEIFGAFGVMPYNWQLQDGEVVWGGIQPEAKQALALLNKWYQEGLIHPDFLTDRWYREVEGKFRNGRVGYINYMASYEAFNPNNPGSLINVMKMLQPGSQLAPGVPPVGPEGHRGHRVWGAAGNIMAFGASAADDPNMMIRVLRILDAKVSDEAFYVETVMGEEGVHWEWKDPTRSTGVVFPEPYADVQTRENLGLTPQNIYFDHADPAITRKYLPQEMVEWNRAHRSTEWARPDLFYWSSSVPRAEEYLAGLEMMQQTVYANIIRGTAPLSAFEDFVENWRRQGGDILLEEARKNYTEAVTAREKLIRLLDATPTADSQGKAGE